MSEPMVRVDGLGKRYRLRHLADGGGHSYTTLRDALTATAAAPWKWLTGTGSGAPTREDFWALRDVSFDVAAGEVVGIIGRNGAGKSTLLKVLSQITEPTSGRVTLNGRVASLLEVGTGFHPELTGRENIFLNGAILGMSRREIVRKFDEIVAFAEVERFLDTPVKRYSSGMYVRLAFGVAAHLEPDVLIVDEVLAVGDAEFQRKSLGKMRDVSRGGRTVLFVSHNMAAINSLSTRAVVLDRGGVVFDGATSEAVAHYSQLAGRGSDRGPLGRGRHSAIVAAQVVDEHGAPAAHYAGGTPLRVAVVVDTDGSPRLSIEVFLVDAMRQKAAMASLHHFEGLTLPERAGRYRLTLELAPMWLASGGYTLDVTTSEVNTRWDHYVEEATAFDVLASNPGGRPWDFQQTLGYGTLAMPCLRAPAFHVEPDDRA